MLRKTLHKIDYKMQRYCIKTFYNARHVILFVCDFNRFDCTADLYAHICWIVFAISLFDIMCCSFELPAGRRGGKTMY